MDEELHHYALCSPHLPYSPPDVHADTPPCQVGWRDNDLEMSHFSSESDGSSVVVRMTMPQPKKRNATRHMRQGQWESCTFSIGTKPQQSVTKPREDGTRGGPT